MIDRIIEKHFLRLMTHYPVVVLTGSRQVGKTTMLKHLFPDREYFNLENPSTLDMIKADPSSFLELHGSNIIIDEAQRFPELFSYIQASVDEHKKSGRILLSGSQNILLSDAVSQSLAGRAAYTELFPLTLSELKNSAQNYVHTDDSHKLNTLFENMFHGFYPEQRTKHIPPDIFFDQYIATYVERDVRMMKNIGNLETFRSFMRIMAGRIGQLIDYASIANDVGVSSNTIKSWLSILEASYLIKILRPLHNNYGKRYIKSPKVYFLDTGLACRLLGIRRADELEGHFLRGNLFENFIIAEIYKEIATCRLDMEMFFYRDTNKNEVDLILETSSSLTAIEIKSSGSFSQSMLKGLKHWSGIHNGQKEKSPKAQDQTIRGFVVYSGKTDSIGSVRMLNWNDLSELL